MNTLQCFFCTIYSIMTIGTSHASFVRDNSTGEAWGYAEVRESAHMFWWLQTGGPQTFPSTNLSTKPFIMWLQGGPGASSTGFGNFAEIGPLDEGLRPRGSTWTQIADLLFVDSPVGTGFSYVTSPDSYTTDETQIDDDLYSLLKNFLDELPEYKSRPFYIIGVSYGGKMCASFGNRLLAGIRANDIQCNFKGVVLGDSWISPTDSVQNWGPYLQQYGLIDNTGLEQVMYMTHATLGAVENGDFTGATDLWKQTQNVIIRLTDDINMYNTLQHHMPTCNEILSKMSSTMNTNIRQKLKIIPDDVVWDSHRMDVFTRQAGNFMKPAIAEVGRLLNSNVKVAVFQGQYDLLCDQPGTEAWISKLAWDGITTFEATPAVPLCVNGVQEGLVKRFQNLEYYFITGAGHMVPTDKPETGLEMLRQIVTESS